MHDVCYKEYVDIKLKECIDQIKKSQRICHNVRQTMNEETTGRDVLMTLYKVIADPTLLDGLELWLPLLDVYKRQLL